MSHPRRPPSLSQEAFEAAVASERAYVEQWLSTRPQFDLNALREKNLPLSMPHTGNNLASHRSQPHLGERFWCVRPMWVHNQPSSKANYCVVESSARPRVGFITEERAAVAAMEEHRAYFKEAHQAAVEKDTPMSDEVACEKAGDEGLTLETAAGGLHGYKSITAYKRKGGSTTSFFGQFKDSSGRSRQTRWCSGPAEAALELARAKACKAGPSQAGPSQAGATVRQSTRRERHSSGSESEEQEMGDSCGGAQAGEEVHDKWVQCDTCDKWRRVPSGVSLRGQWECVQNPDRGFASCMVAEEKWSDDEWLPDSDAAGAEKPNRRGRAAKTAKAAKPNAKRGRKAAAPKEPLALPAAAPAAPPATVSPPTAAPAGQHSSGRGKAKAGEPEPVAAGEPVPAATEVARRGRSAPKHVAANAAKVQASQAKAATAALEPKPNPEPEPEHEPEAEPRGRRSAAPQAAPASSAAAAAPPSEGSQPASDGKPESGARAGKRAPKIAGVVCLSGFSNSDGARWSKLLKAKGGVVEMGGSGGGSIAGISECSHFVVQRPLKRTGKLLAAMSLPSCALVHDEWLAAFETAGKFVDVTPYLLHGAMASDPKAPTIKWSFDATVSRERALAGRCFSGRSFYVTKSTKPSPKDLAVIIGNAGGAVVGGSGALPAGTVVISCEEDRRDFSKPRFSGLPVLRDDHLLTCVMRQELQTDEGRLT